MQDLSDPPDDHRRLQTASVGITTEDSDWEDEKAPPLTCLEQLSPGLEVGPPHHRFRLERQLGAAEKSRVWLALDLSSPDQTAARRALKFFAPSLRDSPQLATLINTQADPAAQRAELLNLRPLLVVIRAKATQAALIDHPHIAKVYGWRYGDDGWPFVEMEYLSGQNLRNWLHGQGERLDWARTLPLVRAVAAALDYAHQNYRLPHRHLDLENVFITDQGVVKVLDFSLLFQPPRAISPQLQPAEIDTDPETPTPYAQTPQQLRFKPDICALAALTYELLTGVPPYPERNFGEQELNPIPLAAVTPPVVANTLVKPSELTDNAWGVLLPCLCFQLEACPDRAEEWVRWLQVAQEPTPAAEPRQTRKPWWTILLVAGITVIGFYLLPGQQFSSLQATFQGLLDHKEQPPADPDELAFAAAAAADTVDAYRAYLQRCSTCAHRQQAEAAVQRLQAQQRAALQARFKDHLQAGKLGGKEGNSNNALAVLRELASLDPKDPFITDGKRQIALAYGEMAQENLKQGKYAEARSQLTQGKTIMTGLKELDSLAAEIAAAEANARDAAAYAQAQQTNTRAAYQFYLAHCESPCRYRSDAETALKQLVPVPPPDSRVFRDPLVDGGQGPEMVRIPAGAFAMGSPLTETGRPRDESLHQVHIDRAFTLGRYEVTFEEYDRFAAATGRPKPADQGWGRGRRPVINVSWQDALAYVDWLSAQTGRRYRLPTEAEWEYAARAGTVTSRYWGNNPNQGCNYANAADLKGQTQFPGWTVMQCEDSYLYTAPVGVYQPNAFGLYDILGNVLEWTCSAYDEAYQGGEQACADPTVTASVVARGGSWSDEPGGVRAADRYKLEPHAQEYYLGFRVLRER